MSENSLKFTDDGCTSLDFLQNLFRKPMFSEVLTQSSFQGDSIRRHHSNRQDCENVFRSFTNIPLVERNNSPTKSYSSSQKCVRGVSITDDDKISTNKFRIFFKTLLLGVKSEESMTQIWQNLQNSMNNPFAFDKFIDDIKKEREEEIKKKKQIQEQLEEREKDFSKAQQKIQQKTKSSSAQKQRNRFQLSNKQRLKSQSKLDIKTKFISASLAQKILKNTLTTEINSIKLILMNGQRLLRQK